MSSNEDDHLELKFKPTEGNNTANEGKSYEIVFLATVVLKLVLDNKISNFKISANDAGYGNFDDVVIRTESNGAEDFFAIQLKYSSKPTSENAIVKIRNLKKKKGPFSILEYFSSVENIERRMKDNFKWILFTNHEVKISQDRSRISIKVNDTDVQIQPNEEPNKFFKHHFFQELKVIGFLVTKEEKEKKKEKDLDFFDNFFIYEHQQNVDQMKKELLEIIKKIHGNFYTLCNFLDFIENWSKEEGEKHYLSKSEMQEVLALCLSSSNIQRINFCKKKNLEKTDTLFRALNTFDVIYLKKYPRHSVWRETKLIDEDDSNEIIPIHTKRIGNLSLDDQTNKCIKLWRINKCPLILKYTTPEDLEKFKIIIDICKNKKFVVLLSNVDTIKLNENVKTFCHLGDLEKYTEIYEKILDMYICSIQRKNSVTWKKLIDGNKDVQEYFTPDELFSYFNKILNIGGEAEETPDPYIKRCLFTNDACNPEKEDDFYETVSSINSKTEKSNVILICDEPGTGKSSFIKQFKNKTFPTRWTVLIHLDLDYTYFSKNPNADKFKEDLEKKVKEKFSENDFNYKVFKIMLKNNNVNCIWDGLDETSFKYVITIIESYSEISHCVTARNNLKQDLEEKFPNTCIRQLKIIDEQKMKGYIEELLKTKNNNGAFKKYLFLKRQKEPLLISHLCKYLIDHTFPIYFKEDENINNENHIQQERSVIENTSKNFSVALKDQNDCVGIITSISNDNTPKFIDQLYENYFAALYVVKNGIPVNKQSTNNQLLLTLIKEIEADLEKKNSGAIAE